MNKAQWREYNRVKQHEYRDNARGHPARPYVKMTQVEEILKAAGHCSFCAMLLSSEYHKQHPLAGCLKAAERDKMKP